MGSFHNDIRISRTSNPLEGGAALRLVLLVAIEMFFR
jgi:hypothetical protein